MRASLLLALAATLVLAVSAPALAHDACEDDPWFDGPHSDCNHMSPPTPCVPWSLAPKCYEPQDFGPAVGLGDPPPDMGVVNEPPTISERPATPQMHCSFDYDVELSELLGAAFVTRSCDCTLGPDTKLHISEHSIVPMSDRGVLFARIPARAAYMLDHLSELILGSAILGTLTAFAFRNSRRRRT